MEQWSSWFTVRDSRFTILNSVIINFDSAASTDMVQDKTNPSVQYWDVYVMIYNPSIHHLLKNIKTVETLSVWCWHEIRDFILLRSDSIYFWTSWRWIVRANRHQTNTSAQWDKRSWWFPFKIRRQYEFGTIWI